MSSMTKHVSKAGQVDPSTLTGIISKIPSLLLFAVIRVFLSSVPAWGMMTLLAMLTCGFAVTFHGPMIRCGAIKAQILTSQRCFSFVYLRNLLALRWFMTYISTVDALFGIKVQSTCLVEFVGAIPLRNSVFIELSLC